MFLSILLTLILMPKFILYCKKIQKNGQPIRSDGPENHLLKKGTPTMGGLLIIAITFLCTFLFADLSNQYILICLFASLSYCLIGAIDDLKKLKKNDSRGLSAKNKLLLQSLFAFLIISWANSVNNTVFYKDFLTFPFLKDFSLNLGYLYTLIRLGVIVGASNAVNITDGLDGLAVVPMLFSSFVFIVFCYFMGNKIFSEYLWLTHQKGVAEMCIFLSSLVGACLGFLWYNAKPAQIFMGDSGSLSLGGVLGTIAVIIKSEILLAIVGGVFVIEALSVIIQVYYFKLTKGKRIFKMAPLHHHFEKCGLSETQVVIRFWIISWLFCLIGLSSLKLR
jgi:phospho-N-acetylmuramoyl-pentapeptide-transferase